MSKEQAQNALRNARKRLSSYYHPDCGERTEVNDYVIELAAMDPWFFPLNVTDCDGCETAPMDEVMVTKQSTLRDVFVEMRAAVPMSGKVVRFTVIPLIFGVAAATAAFLAPMKDPDNVNYPAMLAICGGLGCGAGYFVSRNVFKVFRRMGFFWPVESATDSDRRSVHSS